MKFKRYAIVMALGIMSIVAMVRCTDESENDADNSDIDNQDNTGGSESDNSAGTKDSAIPVSISASAKADSLNFTKKALYKYEKSVETTAVKNEITANIQSKFPLAHISEMDLDNGSVSFTKEEAFFDPMENTAGLPGSAVADSMARDHLNGLGLLPDNEDEMVVEHIGGINTASYDQTTGATTILKNLVTVHYSRQIDGIPVKGQSKMAAYLGKDGELAGVIKKWTKVKSGTKAGNSDMKSTDAAVSDMKKLIQGHYADAKGKVKGITISNVALVMYDDGNVIEPALYSEGEIANADGVSDKEYWITPILNSPNGKYDINNKPQFSTHPTAAPAAAASTQTR